MITKASIKKRINKLEEKAMLKPMIVLIWDMPVPGEELPDPPIRIPDPKMIREAQK